MRPKGLRLPARLDPAQRATTGTQTRREHDNHVCRYGGPADNMGRGSRCVGCVRCVAVSSTLRRHLLPQLLDEKRSKRPHQDGVRPIVAVPQDAFGKQSVRIRHDVGAMPEPTKVRLGGLRRSKRFAVPAVDLPPPRVPRVQGLNQVKHGLPEMSTAMAISDTIRVSHCDLRRTVAAQKRHWLSGGHGPAHSHTAERTRRGSCARRRLKRLTTYGAPTRGGSPRHPLL